MKYLIIIFICFVGLISYKQSTANAANVNKIQTADTKEVQEFYDNLNNELALECLDCGFYHTAFPQPKQ